ncbi:MAG: hypothetical protein HKN13_11570 [Rhodothermales bacterium]|nr:hypothetical protein [Rhodothermales bacterium]
MAGRCRSATTLTVGFGKVPGLENSVISLSEFAAYLSDELDAQRREELTTFFSDHPDARELLQMSFEAWKAGGNQNPKMIEQNGPVVRRG